MNRRNASSWMVTCALVFAASAAWAIDASRQQAKPPQKPSVVSASCSRAQMALASAETERDNLLKQVETAKKNLSRCLATAQGKSTSPLTDPKACRTERDTVTRTEAQVKAKEEQIGQLKKDVDAACKK